MRPLLQSLQSLPRTTPDSLQRASPGTANSTTEEAMRANDRGQLLPLLAAIIVVAGVAMFVIAELGRAATEHAQARTAADAAALAGAAAGESEAAKLAVVNGGRLVSYATAGDDTEVRVVVGDGDAAARARRYRAPVAGSKIGLAPQMLVAIATAEQLLGQEIPVVSGFRSNEQQQRLWDNRRTNRYPVAPPGRSLHEHGLAIDVPRSFVSTLLTVAADAGLCHPLPVRDPVHFVLCRPLR